MKNYLTIVAMLLFAGVASGQTYRAPVVGKQEKVRAMRPPPPVVERANVQGAIPRGIRGGNPIQLLNPKAPAQYGTAMQSVIFDWDTGKWKGIKLFEIFF